MFSMNQESLAKQVLDKLSKLQELPNEGFLCGGSVTNTILSIIDGKEYPINDLDVFNIDREKSHSNAPLRITNDDINTDRYENRSIIPSNVKCNYRITTTHYKDLINYVYVYFSYHADEMSIKDRYRMILDSFDINCCKAGIDLSTGDLFLTQDFTNFIRTRQLECVNPVTPAHTAIRLLKKQEDLKAFLNKEEQFKFLSQFYLYDDNVVHSRVNLTLFFGKKYKDLFHKYENELNKYFELWTYAKTCKYCTNLNKIEFEKYSEFSNHDGTIVPNWVHTLQYTDQQMMDRWYETKLWALMPKKYNVLDEELKKYYQPDLGKSPNIIKRLWELIYKQNKKQKNKSLKLLSNKELYPFVIVNDNFHNCDFSDVNVEKLVKFIQENPDFAKLMSISKLNFQESEKLMNMVKKLFPEELELFCELISKEITDEKYFKPDFDNKKILDQNYITNKYNMVKNILSKQLVEKIDLSEFEYKNIIKELICPLDLLWGGKFMHNCLKGYNENGFHYRIERGEIRIFIISDDIERTAVQISKSYSNTYKIDQIYSHSNTNVCVKHKMIADYLIKFLEYKHYLLESQKFIDDFKNNRIYFLDDITKSTYEKYSENVIRRPNRHNIFEPIEPIPVNEIQNFVDEPTLVGMTINPIDERDLIPYTDDEDIDI
jgi:hypothetical protein